MCPSALLFPLARLRQVIRIKGLFSRLVVVTCAMGSDSGAAAISSLERRANLPGASSAASGSGGGEAGAAGAPAERVLAQRRREVMTNTFYKALGKHVAPFCEPILLPFVPSPYGEPAGVRTPTRGDPGSHLHPRMHYPACKTARPYHANPQLALAPSLLLLHPLAGPAASHRRQASNLLFRAATAAGDELEQYHALFRRRCELVDDAMLERPYDEPYQWDAVVAERLTLARPLLALIHDGAAPVYDGAFQALLEADIATMKVRCPHASVRPP